MTIQLYDLTDATRQVFFSPYCWRIRMALRHKGLDVESVPWHFTDKELIGQTGPPRVPVIVDGEKWVNESSTIAAYLDETYPDRPLLMKDAAALASAQFVEAWCNFSVFAPMRAMAVMNVFKIIHEKDKAYFRESREKMLKTKLEQLSTDPIAEKAALTAALRPAEDLFGKQSFFGGDGPSYADYVLFGTLMWPYMVCPESPLEPDSNVAGWFDRLLDLNDGYARSAKRAADL
ncbi:MAG: glutathione S-transferase N-terminal domain-containing protein [Pseudomonadota bacterium]